MKIEEGKAHSRYRYWTVLVDANELQCSVRKLPYPAWIGTIDEKGKINVWTPAASIPRGYKSAARSMLEAARDQLIKEKLVGGAR